MSSRMVVYLMWISFERHSSGVPLYNIEMLGGEGGPTNSILITLYNMR